MQNFKPNLSAYFDRIAYAGSRDTSVEVLREIQWRHSLSIPFENLDIIAGLQIPLDGESLERKLIHERRGGYCFEHNGYLLFVLRALGFSVTTFLARVRWNVPTWIIPPRDHLVLQVGAKGGPWLFDVGFGGLGPAAVIAMNTERDQATIGGNCRLFKTKYGLLHQSQVGDNWTDVYEIDSTPALSVDLDVINWFSSTHPQSRFRQNLIVARSNADGRCTILNRELTISNGNKVERRKLGSADDLLSCLHSYFDLKFPSGTRFGAPGAKWPT
jgi:N-hydroxyarylamine O-acetyltransferase